MAVTLRDIARHVGVSHATVSFVLNHRTDMGITDATRQRVLRAAQELGYRPNRAARALTTGKTEMLAVCVPSLILSPYYAEFVYHIQVAASEQEYETVLWQSLPQKRKLPKHLHVDGFILADCDCPEEDFVDDVGHRKPGLSVGTIARQGWDNLLVNSKSRTWPPPERESPAVEQLAMTAWELLQERLAEPGKPLMTKKF